MEGRRHQACRHRSSRSRLRLAIVAEEEVMVLSMRHRRCRKGRRQICEGRRGSATCGRPRRAEDREGSIGQLTWLGRARAAPLITLLSPPSLQSLGAPSLGPRRWICSLWRSKLWQQWSKSGGGGGGGGGGQPAGLVHAQRVSLPRRHLL
jgi:hypothetical protein